MSKLSIQVDTIQPAMRRGPLRAVEAAGPRRRNIDRQRTQRFRRSGPRPSAAGTAGAFRVGLITGIAIISARSRLSMADRQTCASNRLRRA